MFIYYVYAYVRSKDGTPYYIGKGRGGRAYNKSHTVSVPKDRSKIIFLETNLSEVGALALERRFIRWWGRKDNETGILLNRTDGGDGTSNLSADTIDLIRKSRVGVPRSQTTKKKISEFHKGRVGAMLGKAHSAETKQKMSEASKGNQRALGSTRTAEFKENLSNQKKGIPKSDSTRLKMLEAKKNQPILTCPHCGKEGKPGNIHRYHFDNCKLSTRQQ